MLIFSTTNQQKTTVVLAVEHSPYAANCATTFRLSVDPCTTPIHMAMNQGKRGHDDAFYGLQPSAVPPKRQRCDQEAAGFPMY